MKKIVLVLLLSMATVASAGLKITVDGVIDPADSTIIIKPSDYLTIGVADDGMPEPGTLALGIHSGPGTLDASNHETAPGVMAGMVDDSLKAEELGILNPFITMEITDAQSGILLNGSDFHCEGEGDVTLTIFDYETGEVLDIQVIHQVPEPMTLSLLCLGGLFIRRRVA
jgi:hypothetical protein